MEIAADFTKKVITHFDDTDWIPSPMAGVERKPLDRIGEEVARATSIVRYAPNSKFSPHVHTGGEEFIVLDGVFQDEHGDFPEGSYIRNPPESRHTPGSKLGCIIFVKLWQFQPTDRSHVRIPMKNMLPTPHPLSSTVGYTSLYQDNYEEVCLLSFQANARIEIDAQQGVELFVLTGEITEAKNTLVKHSWLRSPIGSKLSLFAGNNGAKVWLKKNHLQDVENQIQRVQSA